MSDRIFLYDIVSYHGTVIQNTGASHLALCSLWHYGPRPPFRYFQLTELGCGDGTNLIALAFYNPESTFIGIDNANAEINRANKSVQELGLSNIRFMLKDVRELAPHNIEQSDYIIAHGLYSWVPKDAREAILAFCGGNLKPAGLAYISYNAQPGWSIRRLVRETLLRSHSVREAAIEDKAAKAIEVAEKLLEDLPPRNYAHAVLLGDELERVRNGKPFYVFHEYLAEVNEGFWLNDFVEDARKSGLDYVADAQFCRWEGHIPPALKASLAKRNLDIIEEEETADLLGDRSFRASILCRKDAPRTTKTRQEILSDVYIAASLEAESDPFELQEGVVERFNSSDEPYITLGGAITKAAIVLLAAQWPRGTRFDILYEQAKKLILDNGYDLISDTRSQLSRELITLFEAGQVEFRLHEPLYSSNISDYPQAHALARLEAKQRETLTTPFHLPLPFETEALSLLGSLDGSRSRTALHRKFGKTLTEETLTIAARWGLLKQ